MRANLRLGERQAYLVAASGRDTVDYPAAGMLACHWAMVGEKQFESLVAEQRLGGDPPQSARGYIFDVQRTDCGR